MINATNVQTKVLWRFSKPYMGGAMELELILSLDTEIADALDAANALKA